MKFTREEKYIAGVGAALAALVLFFATRPKKSTPTLRGNFGLLNLDPHAGEIILGPRVTPKPAAWPYNKGVFSPADIAAMPARRKALRAAFPYDPKHPDMYDPQHPDKDPLYPRPNDTDQWSHYLGLKPFGQDFDPHSFDNWADQAYARRLLKAGGWLTDEFGRGVPYVAPTYNTSNTDQNRGSLESAVVALGQNIADVVSSVTVVYGALRAAVKGITSSPLWKIAQTGVSFVPGIGTAVSVGMSAAYAYGHDLSLKDAALAAARDALPGGPAAQAAFDVAVGVANGESLSQASIDAARNQLPADARPGFDAGLKAVGG